MPLTEWIRANGQWSGLGGQQPPPPPTQEKWPIIVSPCEGVSGYYPRYQDDWATGLFMYFPGNPSFSAQHATLVGQIPNGVPSVVSPKGTTAANVNAFMTGMTPEWCNQMLVCYYQEPEDNFTTDPVLIAAYRANVEVMAGLVRPYGALNGVHLQEWTIHPQNTNSWGTPENLALYVQGIESSIDCVSWSLFANYYENITAHAGRVRDWMDQYLPGIPWGMGAGACTVQSTDPIGGQRRIDRAAHVLQSADEVMALGGKFFGWFDCDGFLPNQDNLVSKDPLLRDSMLVVKDMLLPGLRLF